MLNKNIEENNKFIIGNYSRYPISIIRGEGSYVYDSNNKKYLDFISGIAVNNLEYDNSCFSSDIKFQGKIKIESGFSDLSFSGLDNKILVLESLLSITLKKSLLFSNISSKSTITNQY